MLGWDHQTPQAKGGPAARGSWLYQATLVTKSHAASLTPFCSAARHPGQQGRVSVAYRESGAVNALLSGFFFLFLPFSSNG